jgi:hypothetical protein
MLHLSCSTYNQNDGSNNGTKQRKNTAVVDGLTHYKDRPTKIMKNLVISTCIIGSGLNRKSFFGYRRRFQSSGM